MAMGKGGGDKGRAKAFGQKTTNLFLLPFDQEHSKRVKTQTLFN